LDNLIGALLDLREALNSGLGILTEGSVIERLRRDCPQYLDPFLANAPCIYDSRARDILRNIYKQYLNIGCEVARPILIFTPTWRANPERVKQAGFSNKKINYDATQFLKNIRNEYKDYSGQILIGGLIGCRGDAYDPSCALSADDAYRFHLPQARELAEAGVDFLIASTIPSVTEAIGMAKAMTSCGSCIISFVIRRNGLLLDGTSLVDAIRLIDTSLSVKPVGYMVNCVHPFVYMEAMENLLRLGSVLPERLIGLQANTSQKSPEELDGSPDLIPEDPEIFGMAMEQVKQKYGLKILGGCCGTDDRHIREIALRMIGKKL
jgi:homocysteine S-methyltransferase